MAEASIVFRDRDMQGTPKIYVDTIEGAAALAARFRHSSYCVDVINSSDQVALRWENGSPYWQLSQVKPIKLDIATYRFERPDEPDWNPEERANLLFEAITCAFKAATEIDDYDRIDRLLARATADHIDLWEIVEDGRQCSMAVRGSLSPDAWSDQIAAWMVDSQRPYLGGVVEHVALSRRFTELRILKGIGRLNVKLADQHAERFKSAGVL